MRKGDDDLPIVGVADKWLLGVRGEPVNGVTDVDVDSGGNVVLNGKGMSVAPAWRAMPNFLVPRRLGDKRPGARAENCYSCFALGEGPFEAGSIGPGLVLAPDGPSHGVVTPDQLASLENLQSALAATQPLWRIDES